MCEYLFEALIDCDKYPVADFWTEYQCNFRKKIVYLQIVL